MSPDCRPAPKPTKARSGRLLDSARGQSCTLRLPMVCSHDPETVVACHLPGYGKGVGTKVSDLHVAYGCARCHDVIDGRAKPPAGLTDAMILDAMLRGLSETQARMVDAGLLIVR